MSAGWWSRQHSPGCHVPARFGQGVRPGRWCSRRSGFRLAAAPSGSPALLRPPIEGGTHPEAAISVGVAAPGSSPIQWVTRHIDALYALAYLHSHDHDTAYQAVAGALGHVQRDLDADAPIDGRAGWGGLWRALADRLHTTCPLDPAETDTGDDAARSGVGVLGREAMALHAGGCTESHAAGLLGVSRPVVRRLRRAR
jgi:hypothetical protein